MEVCEGDGGGAESWGGSGREAFSGVRLVASLRLGGGWEDEGERLGWERVPRTEREWDVLTIFLVGLLVVLGGWVFYEGWFVLLDFCISR